MDNELYLIFIKIAGIGYDDNRIYDFIYSDTKVDVDGEDWDFYPASGRPKVPHDIFIKEVSRLESKIELKTVQNSDTFALWDALDGVIALAWEDTDNYVDYPDNRLVFKFGEAKDKVEAKLYERDLTLEYKKQIHGKGE